MKNNLSRFAMKKTVGYYIAVGLLPFLLAACEDNREQYWDDFSTILYFRDSGEMACQLYTPDDEATCSVSVVKAGTDAKAATSVDVEVMDEAALAAYNAAEGTRYALLPADCYDFEGGHLAFASSDLYKRLEARFHTAPVSTLLAGAQPGTDYVLPLCLTGSADSINAEKQYVFIRPEVVTPQVGFENPGYVMNSLSASGESALDLEVPLRLSVENRWTFSCYTAVDAALLDAYNMAEGTSYLMLPEAAYRIEGDGTVGMEPGTDGNLHVSVGSEGLSFGNYALPLQITGTSLASIGVDPDEDVCLLGVSYVPDASALQQVALTEDMITYHPDSNPGEGSVAALLDGDPGTYYHSDYNVGVPLPHWLQFALPGGCSAFRFEYVTRNAGEHVIPSRISLWGSADGTEFNRLMTIGEGLPATVGATYTSPVLVAGQEIRYIRFSVDASPSGSFALAEFRLWTL